MSPRKRPIGRAERRSPAPPGRACAQSTRSVVPSPVFAFLLDLRIGKTSAGCLAEKNPSVNSTGPPFPGAFGPCRVSAWTPQIADALAADPHRWATVAQAQTAVAALEDEIQNRPKYLQSFVRCEQGNPADATDADGDGVPWCNDCDDGNAAAHPAAPEICGNHVDDNCDGVVDENCPGETPGYPSQPDAGTAPGVSVSGGTPDGGMH